MCVIHFLWKKYIFNHLFKTSLFAAAATTTTKTFLYDKLDLQLLPFGRIQGKTRNYYY